MTAVVREPLVLTPTRPAGATAAVPRGVVRALAVAGRVLGGAVVLVIFLGPFLWMLSTSFQTAAEASSLPPTLWPEQFSLDNFVEAFRRVDFTHFAVNSIIITGATVIGQIVLIVPAAYAFARHEFPGRATLFGIVLATMLIPGQLIFLPVFVMYAEAGLLNTHASLVLPFLASGFGLFMLRQRFMQVPDAILEAARLDDAGELRILWTIMLPMAKPTIATVALLTFVGTWNNYFFPLVWTTTESVRTLPLAVDRLVRVDEFAPNIAMAGNVLLIIPAVVVFLLTRRHIMNAFTYTGVK
ncbi:carbohydrate ABC transporter permease [Microbacterium xanthum]|uniref:carbohydrate ABC transporter permease n=1 Tax=Microbacterium xanthum TaxID=3079794 RepID=UPI002AD49318|nr:MULTISPECIES: carbohydrate ABC transporter permease [unclassified Microbacterium]MDZ8170707.1 carbohydrate ABC transporter permease [Microbacterium sp. KSW-48]MDZ8201233.1 carbohydrate ABC transporter permease [Microbacterium sp. SSW1-59]